MYNYLISPPLPPPLCLLLGLLPRLSCYRQIGYMYIYLWATIYSSFYLLLSLFNGRCFSFLNFYSAIHTSCYLSSVLEPFNCLWIVPLVVLSLWNQLALAFILLSRGFWMDLFICMFKLMLLQLLFDILYIYMRVYMYVYMPILQIPYFFPNFFPSH